jgi:hypothetical protein
MMATLDVLERAAAAAHNLIITHEPTFYSHFDTTEGLQKNPTYRLKANYIRDHQLVVFRFHDHWHSMTPDGISPGMERELGWTNNVNPQISWQFTFPETPLHAFAATMAKTLNSHSMRILGETREWKLVEWVQVQITSGMKRALILINHVVSEQAGMRLASNCQCMRYFLRCLSGVLFRLGMCSTLS